MIEHIGVPLLVLYDHQHGKLALRRSQHELGGRERSEEQASQIDQPRPPQSDLRHLEEHALPSN